MIHCPERREYVDYTTRITLDYFQSPGGSTMPEMHAHNHYELMIVLQGKLYLQCEQQQFVQQAPFALLYPPLTMHKANADHGQPYERYIVYFSESALQSLRPVLQAAPSLRSETTAPMRLFVLEATILERLLFYVLRLFDTESPPDSVEETALLALILHILERLPQEKSPQPIRKERLYISDVMRYIAENDSRDFHLSEVCEQFFVSPAKLRRDFRAATGTTLKGFQRRLRIDRAKTLLDGGSTLVETMLACHFGSMSDFSRVFKAICGVTPNAYLQKGASARRPGEQKTERF